MIRWPARSTVCSNRCNKAGIQIRGEDGVLDGNGNVTGHGVDATGNVTDIKARDGSAVVMVYGSTVSDLYDWSDQPVNGF